MSTGRLQGSGSLGMQARLVVRTLFNSLVTIDAELNYVPDLAESWEILENSKVYVFHLRKGVKFHDGTDFDAEAVRWNYQRVVDPEKRRSMPPITTSSRRWRSSTAPSIYGA
jgi:ABC-type transport system substrate-binding protein